MGIDIYKYILIQDIQIVLYL